MREQISSSRGCALRVGASGAVFLGAGRCGLLRDSVFPKGGAHTIAAGAADWRRQA